MNENVKKFGLIAIALIAVAAVGYQAMKMTSGEKPNVVRTINAPPGHKSEKEQALEAQQSGATTEGGKDVDLGGDPVSGQGKQ